jgi:hypoxanthine phosphoribosyltransferase
METPNPLRERFRMQKPLTNASHPHAHQSPIESMKEMIRGRQVSRCSRPPARWRRELKGVLIRQPQIAQRVRKLANEIERDFAGRDLVVVSLLNGTVLFLADLIRHLSLPMRLDFIGVSSYREGTESHELILTKALRLEVRGRDVLVVDDILDTGRTLKCVLDKLRELEPRRIKVCVLLEKKARRVEKVRADYVGFSIPDLFVVGYGLDFAERYRNLPFVGILNPQYYRIG